MVYSMTEKISAVYPSKHKIRRLILKVLSEHGKLGFRRLHDLIKQYQEEEYQKQEARLFPFKGVGTKEKRCKLSSATLAIYLKEMVKNGELVREEKKNRVFYRLSDISNVELEILNLMNSLENMLLNPSDFKEFFDFRFKELINLYYVRYSDYEEFMKEVHRKWKNSHYKKLSVIISDLLKSLYKLLFIVFAPEIAVLYEKKHRRKSRYVKLEVIERDGKTSIRLKLPDIKQLDTLVSVSYEEVINTFLKKLETLEHFF